MASHIIRPDGRKRPKSSLAARRLIRAAVRKHGSQVKAARALQLPNQAQLSKMLSGRLADTPAMRAALKRAEARARRAYYLVRDETPQVIEVETVCRLLKEIDERVAVVRELIKDKEMKDEG